MATKKVAKKLVNDGKVFVLGHLGNDIIDTLMIKVQPIASSFVAIDSDQIAIALNAGVSIESGFELMEAAARF